MSTTPKTHRDRPLRIGCASGFWGDSEAGAAQLVQHGQIDYLVFDYLAEITMSLLARARAKSPEAGYAPDFVKVIGQLAPQIQAQGIRVVANAGGVNPQACASALAAALKVNRGLTDLNLYYNLIGVDGARALAAARNANRRLIS